MQLFYTNQYHDNGGLITGQEAIHCAKVLRRSVGQSIGVVDGQGTLRKGQITSITKSEVAFTNLDVIRHDPETHEKLPGIAFGILKNDTRMEWMIEKCVEIGVRVLVPLICGHSEKRRLKTGRLEKILISAMKQSNRLFLPELSAPIHFNDWIQERASKNLWMAHHKTGNAHLSQVMTGTPPYDVIIGPEGDFTTDEIKQAQLLGIPLVNLSDYRLRSETAAILSCALLNG